MNLAQRQPSAESGKCARWKRQQRGPHVGEATLSLGFPFSENGLFHAAAAEAGVPRVLFLECASHACALFPPRHVGKVERVWCIHLPRKGWSMAPALQKPARYFQNLLTPLRSFYLACGPPGPPGPPPGPPGSPPGPPGPPMGPAAGFGSALVTFSSSTSNTSTEFGPILSPWTWSL